MPPISPMKDASDRENREKRHAYPPAYFRISNEVYQLITANKRLDHPNTSHPRTLPYKAMITTCRMPETANTYPTSPPAAYSPDDGATA